MKQKQISFELGCHSSLPKAVVVVITGGDRVVLRAENLSSLSLSCLLFCVFLIRFTSGTTPTANGYEIEFVMTSTDLNELKKRPSLATSQANTFLTTSSELVKDSGSLSAIARTTPLQAQEFIADTTRPTMLNITVNLHSGSVTLLFSEAVNLTSLAPADLLLQSASSLSASKQSFRLRTGFLVPERQQHLDTALL